MIFLSFYNKKYRRDCNRHNFRNYNRNPNTVNLPNQRQEQNGDANETLQSWKVWKESLEATLAG